MPNTPQKLRRRCRFVGHVQGVGFRYTACNVAMGYAITGYVRNMPDGSVELVMEGAPGDMEQIVAEIRRRMEGFLRSVNVQEEPVTGEFARFTIR